MSEAPSIVAQLDRITPRIRRYTGPSISLDDLKQDVAIRLLEDRRFSDRSDAYVVGAAKNIARDHMRSAGRRRAREAEVALGSDASVFSDDPLAIAAMKERGTLLAEVIRSSKLSPDHRCELKAWSRGRLGEFAARERLNYCTCRTRVSRAIGKRKRYVEKKPALSESLY